MACSSLVNIIKKHSVSRLCNIFIKKSPSYLSISIKSYSLDTDFTSKIYYIFSTVNKIKISISRHESLFSEPHSKFDVKFPVNFVILGGRTTSLENRVNQIENRLFNIKPPNSLLDEIVIYEVPIRQSRFRNLIILNMPESDGNTSSSIDTLLIKPILDRVFSNLATTVVSR